MWHFRNSVHLVACIFGGSWAQKKSYDSVVYSLCLLILLILSFAEKMFLILMNSNLPCFSFMGYTLGLVSKESRNLRSRNFSLMLSSRVFIGLHLFIVL